MNRNAGNRIAGFDILRCIAILFVLLSHTSILLSFSKEVADFFLIFFGFTGVEIFFVLSGYLVGKILLELFLEKSFSFHIVKYFWIRRWFRTLPNYYLSLVLYAILFYFSTHSFIFSDRYNLLYFVFLQNFVKPHPEFFTLAWSLSVEEWFYLIAPVWLILFHFILRAQRKAIFFSIIILIIAISLLRLFVVYYYNPEWDAGVRRIVPLRLDTLMIGVLMAYLHIYYNKLWNKHAIKGFITGSLILLASCSLLYVDVIRTSMKAGFFSKTFLFDLFSISVALCMPYMTTIKNLKNRFVGKIVRHISIISYSLYLLHVLIMFLVVTAFNKLGVQHANYIEFSVTWMFCIITASIMYKLYELPLMNVRERFRL